MYKEMTDNRLPGDWVGAETGEVYKSIFDFIDSIFIILN